MLWIIIALDTAIPQELEVFAKRIVFIIAVHLEMLDQRCMDVRFAPNSVSSAIICSYEFEYGLVHSVNGGSV